MPARSLVRMIVGNTVRSPKHFVLSAFGIVVGIASFVFFLGLSLGVRDVILGKIFPLDVVEVVAPQTSIGGVDLTDPLDDSDVAKIRAHPDVGEALPRMRTAFPAAGMGTFEGEEIKFEVGGFCDGIDPSYLASDPKIGPLFKDWEEDELRSEECTPNPKKNPCTNPDYYYCDSSDLLCHRRVPVIVSPTVLELYNGQVASSHGLPVIGDVETFMAERAGGRLRFTILLGDTMVAGGSKKSKVKDSDKRQIEGMLVGVSTKAMNIGMTIPIEYVRRWNLEFSGEEAANRYSSIVVTLKDKDRLAPFSTWLEANNLRLEDSLGERFATAIFIVTALLIFISFVIVAISSINIAHNFFMQVSERRREIGVLRAVGATKSDVRLIILGEAALIGMIGGLIGIGLALGASVLVDWASANYLPRFPFKPDTYFKFEWWVVGGALAFSTVFCVLGGFLPARKAAKLAPAQALAQN